MVTVKVSTTDTHNLTLLQALERVVIELTLLRLPKGNVWGNF